jgi:glycosyltransferase involved in cell wall biosynthesis
MHSRLVSIMMPAYNAEQYIAQSIESVLAQSYPNWELIIVNDGSKDNTAKIVGRYTHDPRIKLIHQANGGEASARNTALEHMQGDYVSFLDADDLYLPDALTDLSKFLEQNLEYDAVFSDSHFCDERGKKLKRRLSEVRPGICTNDILEPLILNAAVIGAVNCVMVRRNVIERHKIRFDKNLVIGPDWDFWIQLARYARFGYLDKLTCIYRVHYTNITRTSGLQKRLDDLVYGRMKVMNSDWFRDLSAPTQYQFFKMFLTDLLVGQPMQQKVILEDEQFRKLSKQDQAHIWRLVGSKYILMGSDQNFAVECLQKSVSLWPSDQKSQYLLWSILHLGTPTAQNLLRLWQVGHKTATNLRMLGQRKPKPVPAQLLPVSD